MLNNDTLDKELDAFLGADNNTPGAETKPITQGGNLDKELDAFLATDKGEEQPLMIRHLDNEPDKEVAERMKLENEMQDMAIGLGAQSLQRTKAQVKNNLHMPQQMLPNSAASVDARLAVIDDKLSNLEKKVVAESNRDAEAIPEVVSAFVPAGAIRPRDAQRFASHEALGGKAIRDARDKINSIRKNNLTSGIAEGFDWVSALTLGLNDLASGAHLNSVLKKKYEGKELTEREQLAYDIYEITQGLESIQQETGGASLWNTIGKGVGFTAEVASSMPIGVGLVGSGVKMTSLGAKAGLKLTKEAFKEGVVSGLKRGLIETSKVAGRSAANIARAEAVGFLSAPITPTSWSAFIEKRNEQFKLNNGNLEYAEKAAWKDLADTWIEQANEISSEVMGSRIATVVGGAAKNFGRLIRLDKVADKIGIGAASRTFMGLRKPAYVREFEKSIGFTGFLGEPLSEFWGDVASESMKSMLTDNGDFSKIMSSDYWLQTLGVCSLYGGAVSIATAPATIAEYKKSNIYGVSKARGNALTRISDRALRNELLSISAIDDINIASKELATLPWDNYSKADIASAMDFIRADYVEKVLLGDANENKRMQMYEGVALSTSELAYRGQDGNDITEDIVSIDTDSGRYVVISGVVDANTDNMLQCMDANGNIVPIHASKIQGVFKHSLQQEMGDRYQQMFASQVEQDRQADIIDTYKDMKNPAREDVQRVMNAFGVKEHQTGESVTLVDGRQGVVDSFEDDGVYIINVPTEQGAQLLSVPFYDVLAEDTTIAEAQSMNYAMRTFSDMELAMKDDLKQSTPTESVTTEEIKATKFAVNEPVYAPNGKQAIIREINEDGTYTIDYNTNPNARLEDMQLDVVPEGDLSSGITTIEEDVVAQETPETQVEMEATSYEAEVKDIPTQENGSVDYNAISDPKQYAELFAKDMGGIEIAATQIQKMADATRKEVEKLVAKSESLVDANEVVRNNKAIAALNERLSFYGDVLNTLTPPQPQQKVEEDAPNPKSEKKVDVGLVANEYSEKLPKAQMEAIDKMAKLLGLSVVFVDSVEAANGAKANADIKGNEVRIAYENRDRAIDFLVGHEFTHRMQDLSPEAYEEFKKSVKEYLGEDEWNRRMVAQARKYRYNRVRYTKELLEDECIADFAGQLVEGKDVFTNYVNKNKENKGLLSVIADVLRAIRDFIFNADAEAAKPLNATISTLENLVAESQAAQSKMTENTSTAETQTLTTANGDMVADVNEATGQGRFSLRTYREGGRDVLANFLSTRVKDEALTESEASDMMRQMDDIYNLCMAMEDEYAPFGAWSEAKVETDKNGNPVFSVIKSNGDYAMNLDFSLVCKKRRTLDAVLNEMIKRGMINTLPDDPKEIAKINDVIRKYGFETACRLCFVDAKRFRVLKVANDFANMYNDMVDMLIPKGKKIPVNKFSYAVATEDVEGGLETMSDDALNIKALEKIGNKMKKNKEGKMVLDGSVPAKIARHLLENPQDRRHVQASDFVSTLGFDNVKTQNPELLSLYNSKKGSGGPKASFSDVQYLNDILTQNWSTEAAYAVGGVRLQSFSDYVPRMVFDYIQMVADLAAKGLPVHAYTKEELFAKIFGLTGIKINLSLVPKVVEGGVAAGLDAEGNYAWQEGETFPYNVAVEIQNAEGYKENCGTIAVGVSDEQIWKMLDDPNIRMIIPYHKSGLAKNVAIHNNIAAFKDYTNVQNTRKGGKKIAGEEALKGMPNFNEEVRKTNDPRKAATAYLDWCKSKGYTPKFDKFASHPNYYKLLEDFTTLVDDVYMPQEAVQFVFPTENSAFGSLETLIEQGLEEDAILEGQRDAKVGAIVDELQGQTKYSLIGEQGASVLAELGKLGVEFRETDNQGKTRFSLISPEMDASYLDAVERGDMATAQRMVMEAAKLAMPNTKVVDDDGNPKVVYHYSNKPKIRVFNPFRRAEELTGVEIEKLGKIRESFNEGKRPLIRPFMGIWATPIRGEYADYGKYEYALFADIRNPRITDRISPNLSGNKNADGVFSYSDDVLYEVSTILPERFKSADPVTYDDAGNVIPLSERFNPNKEDIRYSLSAPTFYSNAEYAVRNIKQEKATPEQWLKMIEKAGGLKAGEDKWLGLSDWLKASDKKTLTKDEVLQYIADNNFVIEEVEYADVADISREEIYESSEFEALRESLTEYDDEDNPYINRERYDDLRSESPDFVDGFSLDYWGEELEIDSPAAAATYLGLTKADKEINETRLNYTTQGLSNKREIALVVPSIEPYNQNDEIHFGDAGEGRAVAWVRFGEAEVPKNVPMHQRVDGFDAPFKNVAGYDVYAPEGRGGKFSKDYVIYGKLKDGSEAYIGYIDTKPISKHDTLEEARNAMNEYYEANPRMITRYDKVLVIDEIQSKRHQDGREKGYTDANTESVIKAAEERLRQANKDLEAYKNPLKEKYGFNEMQGSLMQRIKAFNAALSAEENAELERLAEERNDAETVWQELASKRYGVPSAPFEKNWAELAMKRMLRYAAENGFDKVAWTTGEQQAERYDIGKVVSRVLSYPFEGKTKVVINLQYDSPLKMTVNSEGVVEKSNNGTEGQSLADVVGKELANKIMNGEGEPATVYDGGDIEAKEISGDGLRIGGEGMKAFYDQMLPSFMNKYGKKWGVKVGTVEMSNLEENNTMHSVDVTDAMRESVMQGQPRFALQDTISAEEQVRIYMQNKHLKAKQNIRKKYRTARQVAKLDYNEKRAARQAKIRDMRTNSAKVEYILGEVIEATMPYEHQAYAKIARGEIKMPWETLSAEIGVKKGEKRIYAGITKGANPNNTFDSVVHQWWEELNGYENNIDTQDLRNALIDALRTAPSSTRALQELNVIYDKDSGILSNTMDDLERMEAEEISAEDARYAEEERSFNADKSAHIAAFERDAAFYSQLEVMDATVVAIREKLEKTKMGLEKRQQNRYYKGLMEAIAEVKQAVKNVISSKTIENLDRNELRRVIDKIDNARSLGDVDAIVSELENITLTAMTRHQDKDLNRMLKLRLPNGVSVEKWVGDQVKAGRMSRADADVILRDKWKGRNASGVNIAKWVDNTTSEIMQWVAAKIGAALAKDNVIVAESEVEANNARIEELEQKGANTTNGTAMPSDRFTDTDDIELKGRILYGKFLNAMSAKKSIAILQDERAEIYEHYYRVSGREAARDKHLEANMKALVEATRQYKEAMDMANEAFATLLKEGREALSLFRREQEAHKAMIINMGCDALDINPRTVPNTPTTMEKIKAYNRAYINAPYYTFQTTLKEIDRRAPNGEGRFYNYFMNGVINCTDKFISQHSMHIEQVAEQMRKILDIKGSNDADIISKVIDLSDSKPLLTVIYGGEDAVSGIKAEQKVLTLSNALYIIAMWRQPKYRDSMIYNGFTEEMYDKVYDAVLGVDEHYITFLNWVNEQFLPSTRLMYDKVHQEMFGTSMANERNYFPAKVVGYDKKEDVSVDDVGNLPSTITGAIVARVHNRNMIDLNMNYFKVLMGHLQEMDQWSSFAPITRDLNALASNTEFRNGCNALMSGLNADRGGKGSLFTNFKTTASIAVNAYRPKSTALDDLLLSVTRGWAGANITWRLSTAIKQLASSPVFAVYALDPVCIGIWAKNSAVTFATQRKTLEWAIANSPMFKKRWESKFAGMDIFNTKVNEYGGYGIYDKVADSKIGRGAKAFDDAISKFASDWGMTPNAFIDAMTVANGIKTVYEYELHRAKKQNGNKPITEKQKREAMIKAEIAFNATQQSSEGAFISEWQANRTLATRIITVYQNSAYGFHRLKVSALNELMKQLDPEYKAKIIDIYGRDANKVLRDARLRAGAQLAQGIVGDLLFVLMGGAGTVPLFRIFSGGDDEGEEQALLIEAFKGAVFNITLGGFVGGNILSSLTSGYTVSLGGALDNLVKDIQSALDYKVFSLASVYHGLNIVARYRYGVDFDTLANIAMGIEGLIEGAATGEGKSEAVMKILNVPQSQINIVAGKRRPGETIQEYITRILRTESIGSVPEVDDEGNIKADQEYWDNPFTPRKYYARQYKKDFDAARTRGVIFREADGDAYANYLDTEEKYNEVVKTLGWDPNATPNKKATEGGKYVAPIEGLGYEEYKEIKRLATDAARKAKKVDTFEGTDENYYKLLTEMIDAKQELINKYNEL